MDGCTCLARLSAFHRATVQVLQHRLAFSSTPPPGIGHTRVTIDASRNIKVVTLSLQLLQNCLMLINALLVERTIAREDMWERLTAQDLRGLTPLFHAPINPLWTICARSLAVLVSGGRLSRRRSLSDACSSVGSDRSYPCRTAGTRLAEGWRRHRAVRKGSK